MSSPFEEAKSLEGGAKDKLRGHAIGEMVKSGIPFQLAVRERIQNLPQGTSIHVVGSEVPWSQSRLGLEGYVDIVADSNGGVTLFIECKSDSSGKPAVFLRPKGEGRASFSPIFFRDPAAAHAGGRYLVAPLRRRTPESAAFCEYKTHGSNVTLESLARSGIAAAETLAESELFAPTGSNLRFYAPVLVTNRPLVLCEFDPKLVNLAGAKASAEDLNKATTQRVPYIRLQKTFLSVPRSVLQWAEKSRFGAEITNRRRSISEQVADFERCFWIVDAEELETFAKDMVQLGFDFAG